MIDPLVFAGAFFATSFLTIGGKIILKETKTDPIVVGLEAFFHVLMFFVFIGIFALTGMLK